MRQIKLTVRYDGTNYSGWQIQSNAVTVQELIQNAVRKMTGEGNNVVGAGRTDAGVHALAQAASFRTEKNIPLDGFVMGINSNLPEDIRIINAEEVSDNFHPIRDSKEKHYRYIISEERSEDPLELNRCWAVGRTLDINEMKKAAKYLIGRHDFSTFKASDGCDDSTVKEIYSIEICGCEGSLSSLQMQGSKLILIDVKGSGFLKHMVRNIVGTLFDVGLLKTSPEEFKNILDSKDRKRAGITAPAHGLYLIGVTY